MWHMIKTTAHTMGSNSVKHFASGRPNMNNEGVFLGQTEHSDGEARSKPYSGSQQTKVEAGHFLIRWQEPSHCLGVKDRVPVLED